MNERLILETPEQVEVSLELAGTAARGVACAIDTLLQVLIIVIALLGLGLLGILNSQDVSDGLSSLQEGSGATQIPLMLMALIGVVAFAVFWGYHVFFELVTSGRTPGKKLLGLRVLKDSGTPVTLSESLIRNLVRVIDFLPVYYGVGLIGSLLNSRGKRLGDLAAGTIVIRERGLPDISPAQLYKSHATGPIRLEPPLEALLAAFLKRRTTLKALRRDELARQMAIPLQSRFGGEGLEPEGFLEALLEAHRKGSTPSWMGSSTNPAAAAAPASLLSPAGTTAGTGAGSGAGTGAGAAAGTGAGAGSGSGMQAPAGLSWAPRAPTPDPDPTPDTDG